MENKIEATVGLFRASYKIGGDKPGAPAFIVHFFVYTPGKTISGLGQITQATNPMTDIPSQLEGEYTYMCVMPKNCHILITATGYVPAKVSKELNVKLRMIVSEDWKSGTANYTYLSNGQWHEITNAPVTIIQGDTIY